MGYKKMKQNLGFADFALATSMRHNRSLKNMDKLDKAIDWSRIDAILMSHYTTGTSDEGADAYPPTAAVQSHAAAKVVPHRLGSGAGKSN